MPGVGGEVGERQTSIGKKRDREELLKASAQAINENLGWVGAWRGWWMEERREADVRRLIRTDAQRSPIPPSSFSGHPIVHHLFFD